MITMIHVWEMIAISMQTGEMIIMIQTWEMITMIKPERWQPEKWYIRYKPERW